ncbi:MAG: P-II family nitrogen regulator [Proteobacteria bacterium]|nr:P-II family nitrogen regulator [Pseudomonadota bacterium]MBU1715423.1 P-II family nitrogen regulator [Pseudomonadota bacterium]
MKEIKAYIRCKVAQDVLDALRKSGVENATLTHILAVGANIDHKYSKLNMEFGREVDKMIKLELICNDDEESSLVEIIRANSHSGHSGDGIISVSALERTIKIKTGEEGTDKLCLLKT